MATMTKRERVRAALAVVDRPPAAMWGHDYLREWSPADLVAATVEEYRARDSDFIKLNPRWTFFAEAWGNTYTPTAAAFNGWFGFNGVSWVVAADASGGC